MGGAGADLDAVLTERLTASADFQEFVRAAIDVAGELCGIGSSEQHIVAEAFTEVGLGDPQPTITEGEDLMAKNVIDFRTKKQISASVRESLATAGDGQTALAATPNSLLQRLVKVYGGIRPLLVFLSNFPILPAVWRTGIKVLNEVLEGLAAVGPDVVVQFKAGKDLGNEPETLKQAS